MKEKKAFKKIVATVLLGLSYDWVKSFKKGRQLYLY